MSASSLQPMHDVCFYVSGNVTVHPDAAIAPDVLLQADPGCHLVIDAEASIGTGSIIQASGGVLAIAKGATVGAKVLMVGCGQVGENACVGSFSTLMLNIEVAVQQVIPPSSLIGDRSRKVVSGHGDRPQPAADPLGLETVSTSSSANQSAQDQSVADADVGADVGTAEIHASEGNGAVPDQATTNSPTSDSSAEHIAAAAAASEEEAPEAIAPDAAAATPRKASQVYGRAAVEQMIRVMFPARQYQFGASNGGSGGDTSSGADADSAEPTQKSDVTDQE